MKQPSHQPPRSQALRLVAAWALGLLVAGATNAQPAGPVPCRSFTADEVEAIPTYDPSPDVVALVGEILALSNLAPNRFVVRAANVENAAAVLCDGEERLLYNPVLFHQLLGESIWTARTILAHELGHLILDHPLAVTERRTNLELEADQFAGGMICKLGGTLGQALEAYGRFGEAAHRAGYPTLPDRKAAAAASWTVALGQGCPDSASNTSPSVRLFPNLDHSLVVGPDNAAGLVQQRVLAAEEIHFEVGLTVDQPLILAAESITFEPTATLRGPKLTLIAQTVEGGTLDASGGPGEAGGEILVAALSLAGTSLIARGGDGVPGKNGDPGAPGGRGRDGRDGKCDPGSGFKGSQDGGSGGDGKNGDPGGNGGPGGDGGRIALLTHQRTALFVDTQGGVGGIGGRGGPGGQGGPGGSGGDGCFGLGGHQPTRPDGPNGRHGHPGPDGLQGAAGSVGRVWSRALTADSELQDLLSAGAGADDLAAVVRG
ncbi:MAG: hypothetical protein AAGE94_22890, partial [Acidobacteriota bacterium]